MLSWLIIVVIICLYAPIGDAWKPLYSSHLRKIAATSLTTGLLLGSNISPSNAIADEKQIEALKQVERVKVSLQYIQSDLEKASDAKSNKTWFSCCEMARNCFRRNAGVYSILAVFEEVFCPASFWFF